MAIHVYVLLADGGPFDSKTVDPDLGSVQVKGVYLDYDAAVEKAIEMTEQELVEFGEEDAGELGLDYDIAKMREPRLSMTERMEAASSIFSVIVGDEQGGIEIINTDAIG